MPDADARLHGRYCVWSQGATELGVSWVTRDGDPWDHTSAQVHEEYRKRLVGDLRPRTSPFPMWVKSGSRQMTTTKARVVEKVGDEAHLVDHLSADTKRVELVQVLFRVGNLLVKVEYSTFDRPVSADRLRQGAVSVSRRVARGLGRMSPPEPTPTAPSGTYAEPPVACAVLSDKQLRKLVDTEADAGTSESANCDWEKPNTPGDPQLELRFWAPQRGPAGDGIAQAKEMFAGWKGSEAAALDLADEALAFREGTPQSPGPPVVVFRKANLLARVEARDRHKAEQAARWIVEALS
ncbi:hypothetical protein E1295_13865 [Nonomuraea mesophila]|uniref:Uncharacterized protein n=1 Tax=Nonomuraea mesophila TaxID=2530382 RepID=A0A4R5FSD0_9ACTN|nr:hypothetical protein [Nonomuraea mesophila]TDE55625.1 hypothetical protein E1295_13865 [Nonomuraea mesophila]